jgi:hypothetical protein
VARLRGRILRREAAPEALVARCGRLGRAPGVTLMQAVTFPMKSARDIIYVGSAARTRPPTVK